MCAYYVTGTDLDARDTWGTKQIHFLLMEQILESLHFNLYGWVLGEVFYNLSYSSQMSSPLAFLNPPGRRQELGWKGWLCLLCSH